MKLSKETLAVMKNFSTINQGIMLRPGNFIMTKTVNNVCYAEATIADTISEELGIYDLNSFLAIMNLVGDDAEIEIDALTGNIQVSNGRIKINYPASDASVIVTPKKPIQMPVADVIFELKADDLKQITRLSRQMNVTRIAVTTENGRLFIKGSDEIDKSNPKEAYALDVGAYEGTGQFNFIINLENMKLIDSDYKVLISSKGAVRFETTNLAYVVAVELDSTSDF